MNDGCSQLWPPQRHRQRTGAALSAMARAQDPNSANSQFFICFAEAPFLYKKYTVVGEVTSGMDVVDKIKKGDKAENGSVAAPDKIVKMQLAGEAEK